MDTGPTARFGDQWAHDCTVTATDVSAMSSGRWAVAVDYEGGVSAARFAQWGSTALSVSGQWCGPAEFAWHSSMNREEYCSAVTNVRHAVERGDVYQVNICRVLHAPMPDPSRSDVAALDRLLADRNPAPFGGYIDFGPGRRQIACASPELFLSVRWRDGKRIIRSGPIKGTGRTEADLLEKDVAENIMIVDLVRNDLSRICTTGSVRVPDLTTVEVHPGLVHLVSYVEGELADGCGWPEIIAATFPPGSVTGAPKSSATRIIDSLEPSPRGPYCGAFGWIDIDTGEAELAVAIRTFWKEGDHLYFGTGAGITWASDPEREWAETELKAERLIAAAALNWPMGVAR